MNYLCWVYFISLTSSVKQKCDTKPQESLLKCLWKCDSHSCILIHLKFIFRLWMFLQKIRMPRDPLATPSSFHYVWGMNDAFSLMRSLFDNQQGCDFYCIIYYDFLLFTTAKQKSTRKCFLRVKTFRKELETFGYSKRVKWTRFSHFCEFLNRFWSIFKRVINFKLFHILQIR